MVVVTGNSLLRKTAGTVAKAEPPSVNYNRWLKPNGNENPILKDSLPSDKSDG